MPTLVTDPELLRQLNAPDPMPASPPDAASAPSQGSPGPFPAPPAGMTRVTDPELLRQLNAPDDHPPPGIRFATAPQGTPGQDGLVWDHDGGRDPKSGELVVAGRPMTQNAPSQGLAAMSSALSGVPIAGPALERAAVKTGAFVRNLLYGDPADQTESAVQGDIARSQAAYPKTSTAAGIGGAVIGTAPAVALAPEMFGAGASGSMLGRVAVGAATGADIGGLDAAVRSGGDPNAMLRGVGGGLVGGGAGPVLGAGLSRVVNAAGRGLAGVMSPPPAGLSAPAANVIGRAVISDAAVGGEGAARLGSAGPNAILADVGPSTARLLDTAINRGGAGSAAAHQAMETRTSQVARDLGADFDRALGPEQGSHTAEAAIRDSTAAARQAAYDHAYSVPVDYTTDAGRALEAIMRDRVPPGIIARANMQMRVDGTPSRQMILRPDGTLERLPDVRQIDYVTRSLNDVARAGDGQGALGGNTAEGRSYGNLARELRNTLRQAVPEYGHALETAAEPIQARNAREFGSELLRSTTPRDVAADMIGHMSGPELRQAQAGLRQALGELMANVQRTLSDPNVESREASAAVKALSSRAAQEKIGLLLGEGERASVQAGLERAAIKLETKARMAPNSATMPRQVTEKIIDDALEPGFAGRVAMGEAKPRCNS